MKAVVMSTIKAALSSSVLSLVSCNLLKKLSGVGLKRSSLRSVA